MSLIVPLVSSNHNLNYIEEILSGISLLLSIIGTVVGLITFDSTKEDAKRQNRTDEITIELKAIADSLKNEVSKINGNFKIAPNDNINSLNNISATGNININYTVNDNNTNKTSFSPKSTSGENGDKNI